MVFIRKTNIRVYSFYIEKKPIEDSVEAAGKLSKQLSVFIKNHLQTFFEYDIVKIYYDNGQIEVSIVNELNNFVYDIPAQRIFANLSKLNPQMLSSLTIKSYLPFSTLCLKMLNLKELFHPTTAYFRLMI